MPTKLDFSISHALVCDDYRVEGNGKGLILGLYQSTIFFTNVPAKFSFFVCLLGYTREDFEAEVEARFVPEDGSDPVVRSTTATVKLKHPSDDGAIKLFLPVRVLPLEISCAGKLLVRVRPKGKNWKTVSKFDVVIDPNFSSGQQQPS